MFPGQEVVLNAHGSRKRTAGRNVLTKQEGVLCISLLPARGKIK